MTYKFALAALLGSILLTSCGGGGSTTPPQPQPGDTIAPVVTFTPTTLTVASSAMGASTLSATDNVAVTTGPSVSCTNGGTFASNVFTAPAVSADTTSVCTATAGDAAGNTGTGTLTVTVTGAPPNGNVILTGGTIRTMNSAQATAEALAYDNTGKIISVGTAATVTAAAGAGAKTINLNGALVLPGFHDVHIHAIEAGINQSRCLLTEFGTIAQYNSEIAACAADQTSASWFIGAGVSMPDLLAQNANPKALLDTLIPTKPALILDNLGHGAWANSQALQVVGFDTLVGNPQGGIINRLGSGAPSGVVYENAQQVLRTAALPPTTANKEANFQALKTSLTTLAENGITSVSDAGGYWTRGHHEAWTRAETEGVLTVRAANAFYVFPEKPLAQQVTDITALKSGTADSLVRFNQVKIYVDGIISQGTAALINPYTNDPGVVNVGTSGFEYFTPSDLQDYTAGFDAAGFGVHFHATGDRGVRLALDAVQTAQNRNGVSANKHKITHIFLANAADHSRFATLGVTADVQMTPSSVSASTISFYRTIIGNRADGIIPTASLLAANAPMTISSDWDADVLSPLVKIETAVTRTSEAVPDVETAVRLMTIEPAKYLAHDNKTGSLVVGKQADIVILDKNIFTIAVDQIDTANVVGTIFNGKTVYDPNGLLQ